MSQRYSCGNCGKTNIQHECWVDVNTDKVLDGIDGNDSVWCPDCEEHSKWFGPLVEVNEEVEECS